MMKSLTMCICLLVLAGGCGEEVDETTPTKRTPSYKDKTPDEWLKLVRRSDGRIRRLAVAALVQYGPTTVPGLTKILEDKTAGPSRLSASRALGGIGSGAKPAVPALAAALRDTGWKDRDGAADALGSIRDGSSQAIGALLGALKDDPDERVRGKAAAALGRIQPGDTRVIAALAAALEDDDANVCAEAADALACFGSRAGDAVAALQEAADAEDFIVSQAATEALKAIRGH